jgi:hypothetical protein
MRKKVIWVLVLSGALASTAAVADPAVASVCNAGACAPVPVPVAAAFLVAAAFKTNIEHNFVAAKDESGVLNQTIRATTGISIGDIERYGLAGGPNSEVNKIGRFFATAFGW